MLGGHIMCWASLQSLQMILLLQKVTCFLQMKYFVL